MMRFKQGETLAFNVVVEDGSIATIVTVSAKLRKETRTLPYPLEGEFVVTSIFEGWRFTLPTFPAVGKYVTDVSLTLTDGTVFKSATMDIEVIQSVT